MTISFKNSLGDVEAVELLGYADLPYFYRAKSLVTGKVLLIHHNAFKITYTEEEIEAFQTHQLRQSLNPS